MNERSSEIKHFLPMVFPRAAAIFSLGIGILVLLGWLFDSLFLKKFLPGFVTMKPNTALCFISYGAAFWLLQNFQKNSKVFLQVAARILTSAGILIAVITLAEYILEINAGIDTLLFSIQPNDENVNFPGRMSPATALNFLILGTALILLSAKKAERFLHTSQWLALLIGLISIITLIGYSYDVNAFHINHSSIGIAFHSAITFLIFSVGILFACGFHGLTAIFSADSAGGLLARRLVPMALIIPFVLGWLGLKGGNAGFYGTEFGVALFAALSIFIFLFFIWWTAWSLDQLDNKRKAAEKFFRDSNENFQALVKASAQVVWSAAENGESEDVAKWWRDLTEQDLAKQQHWEWLESLHPDDRQKAEDAWRHALKNKTNFEVEFRVKDKADKYQFWAIRGVPVFNNDGSFRQWIGTFTNISGRKQLEEDLRLKNIALQDASEELTVQYEELLESQRTIEQERLRYQELFEFAPGGYLVTNTKGVIEQSNETAQVLLKARKKDLEGNPFIAFVTAGSMRQFNKLMLPWRDSTEIRHAELSLRKDGQSFIAAISVAPVFNRQGKVESLRWLMDDITESKEIENALRETEGKLRLFVEYAPAAVAMFDREMNYLAVSRRWLQDYDLPEDVIGKNHYRFFPEMPEYWKQIHQSALTGVVEKCDEDKFIHADGSVTWLKWEVRPWYGANEKIGGLMIFAENITQRKNVDKELRKSEERFRTLFDSIDEGFALIEILYDKEGKPFDLRYLEINKVFERLIGLTEAKGKTAREMIPNISTVRLEIYHRVLQTGESIRFENYSENAHRWFNIFVSCVGEAENHQVALIFDDITERRRTEKKS